MLCATCFAGNVLLIHISTQQNLSHLLTSDSKGHLFMKLGGQKWYLPSLNFCNILFFYHTFFSCDYLYKCKVFCKLDLFIALIIYTIIMLTYPGFFIHLDLVKRERFLKRCFLGFKIYNQLTMRLYEINLRVTDSLYEWTIFWRY